MMNLRRLSSRLGYQVKKLATTAVSTPQGIRVTFPNSNYTVDIDSPLEMMISSIAACQTISLRALAKRKKIEVGDIAWTRIESSYNLGHWKTNGGPCNKMGEVFLQAQIQTGLDHKQLQQLREQTQNMCPAYQVVSGSGIKINSIWRVQENK